MVDFCYHIGGSCELALLQVHEVDSSPAQSRHRDEHKAVHSRPDGAREAWIACDRDVHLIYFRCASRHALPSVVSRLSCSTF